MNIIDLYNPVLFANNILHFQPFDYQEKLLLDNSKRICAVMGRQTGKSTTIAAKTIHYTLINPSTRALVVSATLRQSLLLFEKILSFSKYIRSMVRSKTRSRLDLKNNSSIIALPCGSGSTIRGYTATLLILDEAAFIPEDVINNVFFPMISTTDGSIWMLSTPYSKDHPFYRAYNSAEWSVYKIPSSSNPLIKQSFLDEQRRFIGELAFIQEYAAEFVDDIDTFFPSTLLQRCIDLNTNRRGVLYGGFDPGGRSDPAALVIINYSDKLYEIVYKMSWYNTDYTYINREVVKICKDYNIESLCIDQTGLGNPITESIRSELGYEKVNGIILTSSLKEEILLNLRLLFEEKKVIIPADPELLSSLNCITYKKSSIGYKFEHPNNTHDDLAYALALACWGAREYNKGVMITLDN